MKDIKEFYEELNVEVNITVEESTALLRKQMEHFEESNEFYQQLSVDFDEKSNSEKVSN